MDENSPNLTAPKKAFSRIGFAFCAVAVIAAVLQLLWFRMPVKIWGEDNWFTQSDTGFWLGTFLPIYLAAIPLGLLILRKLPAQVPERHTLRFREFLILLPMAFCLMYGGNLLGTALSMLLSGGTAQNAILDYALDNHPLKVVFVVILAPLLEEYICRKQIIDRTRVYGEKTAAFLSAMVFGLMHQNLFQFFYAFALGYLFAYVYLRTGRLGYCVALHSIINFMGSVIAPWILSLMDMDVLTAMETAAPEEVLSLAAEILPGLLLYMLYAMVLFGLSIAGLVLLIVLREKFVWKGSDSPLPKGKVAGTVYWNAGMVLYILLCVISFVIALLPQ